MKKFILSSVFCAFITCSAFAGEDGYFLSFSQKGELISSGRIKGDDGRIYDIRICPGYKYPVRYGWNNLKQAGGNLGEYFSSEKYSDMIDASGDCLEWAFDDCMYDFAIKGSGKAWKKNFSRAHDRVEKRVFGWWMAYPWAFMKSTVDNVVRIPLGFVGCAAGTAAGTAVVPAYFMTDSMIKAGWNGGVEGLLIPVSGVAWNTVISPPMAIAGQKPAESRVDGFWVRIVPESYTPGKELNSREVFQLAELGLILRVDQKVVDEKREALNKENRERTRVLYEEINKINKDLRSRIEALREEEKKLVENTLRSEKASELSRELKNAGLSRELIRKRQGEIKKHLEKEHGISAQEAWQIINILINFSESITEIPLDLQDHPQKLDPVTESIETIKDIK